MTEMKTLTLPNGVTYEIVDDKARKAIEQDCASVLLQTAEGVCILAEDSSDKTIRGLKIFGKTEQDGEPTPDAPVVLVDVNPTISIHGGNLIPVDYADGDTKVMNGITFTKQEDGSVRVNGIATETAHYSFNMTSNKKPLPSGWLSAYSGVGYGNGIPQVQNDIYVDGVYTLSLQTANKNASVKNLTGKITLGASRIKVDAGVIANNVVIYPMLCASETALPYEPPINAQTITSGRTLRGLPMASGGTYTDNTNQRWVADEVDFERGVHIKRIEEIVLDGSDDEIWYEETTLNNTIMFRIGIADSVNVGNIVGDDFLCSHFRTGQYYNVDAVGAQHTMTQFYFRLAKSSLSDTSLAGFKAWLAANPMTVQYILNTPVVTPLTEDELIAFKQLHTNRPSTTVVSSADTWTEIKYSADLKKVLDGKTIPDDIDETITQAVENYLRENPPSGSNSGGNTDTTIPAAVAAEANRIVDTALTREDSRIFRFLAVADAHQKNEDYYSAEITAGTKELGQAVGEVLRQIGVDFVANLGDTTWGASDSSSATVLEEAKAFNRLFTDSIRGETQIWTEGNHETAKLTESQVHALIYSHNKGLMQDADHWVDGYGYMDFPNQKVRVILLNTNQGTPSNVIDVSDTQLKWFAETALDMSNKADWSVLTLGHHPIGFNNVVLFKNCANVIEAFIAGTNPNFTTNGGTKIDVNYSGKNCQYIGHFHGHVHSYTMTKIRKYVSDGVQQELAAWDICIPNACATRTDQYIRNAEGDYLRTYYSVGGVDYDRPTTDGKRTAFTVVTICLDEKEIYADDYGVTPPNLRNVSYDFAPAQTYVNQLPISTDTDGSIYNGIGYKTDTYLSGGEPKDKSGVETTGFIPFDGSGQYVIYMSGVSAKQTDANFRIMLYDASKTYHSQFATSNFTNNSYAPLVFTTDADGNITKVDMTDAVAKIDKTTAFFRMCAPEINSSSIITVNQPIA